MSYGLRVKLDIGFIGDGMGGVQVPSSQFLRFEVSPNNPVGLTLGSGDGSQWQAPIPGANAPTLANIQTALNSMVTDILAQITPAVLARIQGFATGGG
jgi:hypothetical protein